MNTSNYKVSCTQCTYPYVLYLGACVQSCVNGQYLNAVNRECLICDPSCTQCAGPGVNQCMSCPQPKTLNILYTNYGSCICPDQYQTDSSGNCQPCSPSCKTCTNSSASACTSCVYGRTQSAPGQCLCSVGQQAASNSCSRCPASCTSCLNQNQCYSCQGIRVQNQTNGSCNCPPGQADIQSTGTCLACPSGTASCIQSGGIIVATTCQSGYYLSNNKCVMTCSINQQADTINNVCVNISPSPCITSQNPTYCSKCNSPQYLSLGQCTNQCPLASQGVNNQTLGPICLNNCPTDQVAQGRLCIKSPFCSVINNNTNPLTCSQCMSGYIVKTDDGSCVEVNTCQSLQDYQIDLQGNCSACSNTTASSISPCNSQSQDGCGIDNCQICQYPVNERHSVAVQVQEGEQSPNCIKCLKGQQMDDDSCVPFTTNQTTCNTSYPQLQNGTCFSQCPTNSQMSVDPNLCQDSCPISQQLQQNISMVNPKQTCTDLIYNSTSKNTTNYTACLNQTTNRSQCLNCEATQQLNASNGVCVQQCGEFTQQDSVNKICQPCASNCIFCPNITQCSQCADGQLVNSITTSNNSLNSSCITLSQVNSSQQQSQSTQYVQSCDPSCLNCTNSSANACSACKSNHQLMGSTCQITCGANQQAQNANNTCLRCDESCFNCSGGSNQSCTSCPSNFILQNGSCQAECPLKTQNSGNNSCLSCPSGCDVCSNSNICLECSPGYFLNQANSTQQASTNTSTVCTSSCASHTQSDSQSRACQSCSSACQNCTGPSRSQCVDLCVSPQQSEAGVCVVNCSQSNATDVNSRTCQTDDNFCLGASQFDGVLQKCESCNTTCSSCIGPLSQQCQSCSAGLYYDNGNCTSACPSSNPIALPNRTCIQCSQIPNCVACNASSCSTCQQGYSPNYSTGLCTTSSSTCHQSCSECQGTKQDQCASCSGKGRALKGTSCECQSSQDMGSRDCESNSVLSALNLVGLVATSISMPSAICMIFGDVRILPMWHFIGAMQTISATRYLDINNIAGQKDALAMADNNILSPILNSIIYGWFVDQYNSSGTVENQQNRLLSHSNDQSNQQSHITLRLLQDGASNSNEYGYPNFPGQSNSLLLNCLGLMTVQVIAVLIHAICEFLSQKTVYDTKLLYFRLRDRFRFNLQIILYLFTFYYEIMNLWIFAELTVRNKNASITDIITAVVLVSHIVLMEQIIFIKIKDDSYISDDKQQAIRSAQIFREGPTSKQSYYQHHVAQILVAVVVLANQIFSSWWSMFIVVAIYIVLFCTQIIQHLDKKNRRQVNTYNFRAILLIKLFEMATVVALFTQLIQSREQNQVAYLLALFPILMFYCFAAAQFLAFGQQIYKAIYRAFMKKERLIIKDKSLEMAQFYYSDQNFIESSQRSNAIWYNNPIQESDTVRTKKRNKKLSPLCI